MSFLTRFRLQHQEVSMALRVMGIQHEVEALIPGDPEHRLVDILISPPAPGSPAIALEVDGEQHFAANNLRHELGGTALRNRQLRKAGVGMASVHFMDWDAARTMSERQDYLTKILNEAGFPFQTAGSSRHDAVGTSP